MPLGASPDDYRDVPNPTPATDASLERAVVKTREAISYGEAQRRIDGGEAAPELALLREIGELRRERERARGGVSVNLPGQEVVDAEDGSPVAGALVSVGPGERRTTDADGLARVGPVPAGRPPELPMI